MNANTNVFAVSTKHCSVRLRVPDQCADDVLGLLRPFLTIEDSTRDLRGWTIEAVLGEVKARSSHDGEPCLIEVDPALRRIEITSTRPKELALETVRQTRQLMRFLIAQMGGLFLHASVVSVRQTGVAIVGPKRSGKTLLALALLAGEGGALISNGDPGIEVGDRIVATGWPRSVRIRGDTVTALQSAFGIPGGCVLWHPLNQGQYFPPARADLPDRAFHLIPREIAHVFDCEIRPTGEIDMIVLVSPGEGDARLTRESPDIGIADLPDLLAEIFPFGPLPGSRHAANLGFLLDGVQADAAFRRKVEQIPRKVPIYRMQHDFRRPEAAIDLLRKVL